MSTEVKVEKIPWISIIIVTIIFGSLGIGWLYIIPFSLGNWYGPGTIGCFQQFSQSAFILTVLTVFLTYVGPLRKRVDPRTITYAYAVGLAMANMLAQSTGYNYNQFSTLVADRIIGTKSLDYVPWFAAPSAEIVTNMMTGGIPVPWAEWIPSILFWSTIYSVGSLFYIAFAVILRRSFVEVEKVPFPHTLILHSIIKSLSITDSRPKPSRPFLLGIILGAVFNLPILLGGLFPWFPDIYGWRTNTCGPGAQWLTSDSPLATVIGFAQFNKNPALVATFYLAPLGILFSAVLWNIIFLVLMQIAYTMGYYTGILEEAGCGRVWCGTISFRIGAPFKWFAFTSVGVCTGVALFYFILNRRYFIDTIRAALGTLDKGRIAEMEKDEPISYRNAYIMLFATALLLIILFAIYGVPVAAAITLIITGLVFAVTGTRIYGMVNFVAPAGTGLDFGYLKLVVGEGTLPPSVEWVRTFTFAHSAGSSVYTGWAWPMVSSLGSYTMASKTGVSSKSIFKIVTVVSVLGIFVISVARVQWVYAFGASSLPGVNFGNSYFFNQSAWPDAAAPWPAQPPWEYHAVAGIIFAGILMYLHNTYLWFPLDPIGLILATEGHALIEGIWTVFTIAWVLKAITLRVGGSKIYEDVGVPTVAGFLTGYLLIALIGGLIFVARFFVPF